MSYVRLADLGASAPMTKTEYETYQGLVKAGLTPEDAKAQVYSTRTGEAPKFFSGGFTTAEDQALTAAFESAKRTVKDPVDQITSAMNAILSAKQDQQASSSPLVYVAIGAGVLGVAGLAWWALSGDAPKKSVKRAPAEPQPA